ncbi:YqgE/AlgH family protein [Phytomonospora sp. NPDC050363]|uniref:YqgE/AlgH family protein n=1 Tax=Phytomonospora sp. NPDC050363 TaxID=3155642 RepID=UPI0033FF98E1
MIDYRTVASLSGRLLVASPVLKDPNFDRTVVLLLGHEPDGALGVVLNRATEMPVTDVLEGWDGLIPEPAVVFEGGPVQPESAIAVARLRTDVSQPDCFRTFAGRLGTLDLAADPEPLADSLDGLRIFAGYAGWGPGQLENEIDEGAWLVFDVLPGDAFSPTPEELWPMVWRRQVGLLAAVAFYPADPGMN